MKRETHWEFSGLMDCKTGVHEVRVKLSESERVVFPHTLKIEGYTCLITFRGRPPLCLKCHDIGHTRGNCPQKTQVPTEKQHVVAKIAEKVIIPNVEKTATSEVDNSTMTEVDNVTTRPLVSEQPSQPDPVPPGNAETVETDVALDIEEYRMEEPDDAEFVADTPQGFPLDPPFFTPAKDKS